MTRPFLLLPVLLAACGSGGPPATPPAFTPAAFPIPLAEEAMRSPLAAFEEEETATAASLWTGRRDSLLGDDRAMTRGDILTVVIAIDDSAQIRNSTDRSREGSEGMEVGALFGLPEALDGTVGLSPAVDLSGSSSFAGEGSVRRSEELTLRVAATVTEVLPNGVLAIAGSQEVRVNNELRELLVTGFVRPVDVTRQNEVSYDKIAQARISYGGRGQITDMQQPRAGQQVVDAILPF